MTLMDALTMGPARMIALHAGPIHRREPVDHRSRVPPVATAGSGPRGDAAGRAMPEEAAGA